jgi:hypothetical protein
MSFFDLCCRDIRGIIDNYTKHPGNNWRYSHRIKYGGYGFFIHNNLLFCLGSSCRRLNVLDFDGTLVRYFEFNDFPATHMRFYNNEIALWTPKKTTTIRFYDINFVYLRSLCFREQKVHDFVSTTHGRYAVILQNNGFAVYNKEHGRILFGSDYADDLGVLSNGDFVSIAHNKPAIMKINSTTVESPCKLCSYKSITVDDFDNIWVACSHGVFRLNSTGHVLSHHDVQEKPRYIKFTSTGVAVCCNWDDFVFYTTH